MKIVLDTNILLQSLPVNGKMRPICNAFLKENIELIISNSILLEYEEVLANKTSSSIASNVVALISKAVNADLVEIWYEWNAIRIDPDDNKFFDAAVSGQADYIVTNDKHFNVIKSIDFPKIEIMAADDFLKLLDTNK